MNSLVIFAVCLAVASAGLVPVAPLAKTTVVEGPSSSSTVVGPDGSAIVSAQPGGRIVAHENVGAAAVGYSAPVVAAHGVVTHGYSHGVVAAPVAYAAPFAPSVAYAAAPVVPSVAYASTPYGVAKTLVASPVTASGYPILAPGSGLEGQYIPDINEKLYDDGSYKGEIY